jgi:xylose isomerase
MIAAGDLASELERRYAGWSDGIGAEILDGGLSLADIGERVVAGGVEPHPRSGGQERLENLVNRHIWSVDRER